MDNIKDDLYYVEKIKADLLFVMENTKDKSKEMIQSNALLVDSIMFRIIQISENSDRLSLEFKKKNEKVPWKAMKGMRNLIVHDYGVVDFSIVYGTVKHSIPEYYDMLNSII